MTTRLETTREPESLAQRLTARSPAPFQSARQPDLLDNLMDFEVAFPAIQPARAELAAVSAAHLRADTERVPVTRLAIQRGIGRNQHAFDQSMVTQPPKEFAGAIGRALLAHELQGFQAIAGLQLLPKRLGKIGHRVPTRHAVHIQPFQELSDTIARVVPFSETGPQLFVGLRFDIRRHKPRVAR